jgi:NodT family efflux transporter outer membrane factor (OMF) lipoprotein
VDSSTKHLTGRNPQAVQPRAFPPPSRKACSVVPLAALLMTGCAVGPDFKKPAAPDVGAYTAAPLSATVATPDVAGGDAQRFSEGADIAADWWTLFHSSALNALIEQSLKTNHDLKAAQAALTVARENALAQRGAFYPTISAGYSASRQQQSAALAPVPNGNTFQYDLFTPQLSISYAPDVFGLNRRTVESLTAQAQAVHFQMIAAYTTLTSNVVVTAIQEASVQTQVEATRALIDADAKMVDILKYQSKKGYASGLDLAAQESQLAQATATLPPLLKQLAQLKDQLAVLAGRYPSQTPAGEFNLSSLQLPDELPLSLPSKLVEQRPDVLQAEANLHAASAQIGVAVANRLPNIQLTGNAGTTALAFAQQFAPGNEFWTIGAELTAPIFDGGTLLHQERAARANYNEVAEQYRSAVLTAFQNVADTLTALEQDAEGLKAAAEAERAAKRTLDLTQRQLQDGYTNDLSLMTAEQAYHQTRLSLVQAQASRYADTAALFQALGGGWWHRTDLAMDKHDD